MIVYLDTCSILNLIQVSYSSYNLELVEKAFDKVLIVPIVFDELRNNKYINVIEDENRSVLDEILNSFVRKYIDIHDVREANSFSSRKNLGKFKNNGESHSVSHALNFSRIGGDNFCEFLLKTHIITDDDPAKEDFHHFANINILGKILDSIDLMTLFWLKEYISKNDVLKYCNSLKQLYFREVSLLIQELKSLSNKFSGRFSSSESLMMTDLIIRLSSIDDELSDYLKAVIRHKIYKRFKNTNIDILIKSILDSSIGKKIDYINSRIVDLEKVWQLNE